MSQGELEVDEIRRQMAQIRVGLHHDVSGVVDTAERVMNWRAFLRNMPWLSIGLGFAAGYLIVPRKKAPVPPPAPEPRPFFFRSDAAPPPRTQPPEPEGGGVVSTIIGLAWPIALRAAQSYAAAWIEGHLMRQLQPIGPTPQPSRKSEFPNQPTSP